MEKSTKYILGVLILSLFTLSTPAFATTLPNLGTMASFSFLAATSLDCTTGFCWGPGNLGLSPGTTSDMSPRWRATGEGSGEYFSDTSAPDNLVSATAQADALLAFNNLAGRSPSGSWTGTASTSPTPGVWNNTDATTTFDGTLTLDGGYNDVWIFKIGGDFNFTGNVVMAGHAQPCHVFWQISGSSTITQSGGEFAGTIISAGDITFPAGASGLNGRIISLNGSLTISGGSTVISEPTCACGLTLNKTVDNTNGGTALNTAWTITATSATTSPTNLSGTTPVDSDVAFPDSWNLFKADTYTLAESGGPAGYTASSWVCVGGTQSGSLITVGAGEGAVCTITNTYPTPVVVPSCQSGCGPSGRILPLIEVTKVASPQILPAKGGLVTYTEVVSNPGMFALSNVRVTDDKCAPVNYISGDTNRDSKLDPGETWTYTCRTKLIKTTTNTVIAEGVFYDLTARDSAIATVVVVPNLPNTGLPPKPTFPRSLSVGMKGDDVAALQTALEQKNLLMIPPGVAKGLYGALTRTAVTKYQKNVKLPTVGIFGPLTRAKLISEWGK